MSPDEELAQQLNYDIDGFTNAKARKTAYIF
jgi:hypothetical protein